MKKLLTLVALIIAGVVYATAPANHTVGTTSTTVAVQKSAKNHATDWTSGNVYAQGAVAKNGGNYYMAVNAGTAGATPPTHTTGDVTDGAVTWRFINANRRSGVVITVQTSSTIGGAVNVSLGTSAAVQNKGLRLVGEGATLIFGPEDNYQGAIQVISATGSNVVVGVQEY